MEDSNLLRYLPGLNNSEICRKTKNRIEMQRWLVVTVLIGVYGFARVKILWLFECSDS